MKDITTTKMILDAAINDSSIELFDQLGWLPIDDIIRVRKLFLLHKARVTVLNILITSYFKQLCQVHTWLSYQFGDKYYVMTF